MNRQPLILIHDNDCGGDEVVAEARSVLNHWTSESPPELRSATLAEVLANPTTIDGASVAWVHVGQTKLGDLYEIIGMLEDRQVPTMLTRTGQIEGTLRQDGVVVCPPQFDPAATCAMMAALLSQSPVIREMRAELTLLRAYEGGLCNQIGKIDEELRLAAQLQREFLPRQLVKIDDIEFRVIWRPAGYVGGDIYDVIGLDENHIGFFIADVIGHGVSAALMTMYIKRSLRTKVIDTDHPLGYRIIEPAEVLEQLNQEMVDRQADKVRFATACYGVIDCAKRQVCVARAGHPFPLVLRATGETKTLEPEGGLLGVFPNQQFEQVHTQLDRGDRLLLYSDGFEWAFPAPCNSPARTGDKGQRRASMRYTEEFDNLRHGPLDEALARLEQKLDTQAGSLNQRDDLTLLCMAVVAGNAPISLDQVAAPTTA